MLEKTREGNMKKGGGKERGNALSLLFMNESISAHCHHGKPLMCCLATAAADCLQQLCCLLSFSQLVNDGEGVHSGGHFIPPITLGFFRLSFISYNNTLNKLKFLPDTQTQLTDLVVTLNWS